MGAPVMLSLGPHQWILRRCETSTVPWFPAQAAPPIGPRALYEPGRARLARYLPSMGESGNSTTRSWLRYMVE
jgi:hypothetical protein